LQCTFFFAPRHRRARRIAATFAAFRPAQPASETIGFGSGKDCDAVAQPMEPAPLTPAATPADIRAERSRGTLDLGHEPPIEADGLDHTEDDRRRVSLRWLSGTVLTGLSGALLIGAAIHVALNRQMRIAEAPVMATSKSRESAGDVSVNPRKGDRLVKSVDIVAAKQTFRTPTSIRSGDKEVVKTRAFTRVATTLTLTGAGFSDEVPTFNPLKLLADARNAGEAAADAEPAIEDADVSFQTRDLAREGEVTPSGALTAAEVQAQLAEYVKSVAAAGARAPLPLPPQLMLMRTSRAAFNPVGTLSYARAGEAIMNAPFSSIEVRMVPENVTQVARSADSQPTQMSEKLALVRRGEGLDDVLRANGVPRDRIAAVMAAFGAKRGEPPASEGQKVKMLFADFAGDGVMSLARVSIYADDKLVVTAAAMDRGAFLQVARGEQAKPVVSRRRAADDEDEDEEDSGGMRLYNSFYETALKQDIPKPIIDDLVRVFANDVDFQRSVAGGDSFEAFYDENDEGERSDLLYASITTRNETFRYYRFQTPDDAIVDYYDENGRSTRKFLIRKPIATGETRSGFGMRRHPILGYYKMHTGVDWSAPIGTPIFAAGNGTVIKSGWSSGYGRRVEIQHVNGYISAYSHMSGFGRGISEGVRVRQGQVVGFLGSSGLSTGPHLHYEVMVNGHFVDPMRVKLARTREFDGRLLGEFKRERDRIDGLMAKAPNATRVAERAGR
jgi:murein DD-endopeptidase MepM/ murein hydrolase activator NlpD